MISRLVLTAAMVAALPGLAGEVVLRVPTDQKLIALTFDDGPNKANEQQLLALFEKEGVKSTFFYGGKGIPQNVEWTRRLSEAGHEIGNHAFTHPNFTTIKDPEKTRQEVVDTQKAIKEAIGKDCVLFRAPYIQHSDLLWAVLAELKLPSIGCGVGSKDWEKGITKEAILENVTANAKAGDVVLMHSWSNNTIAAMPEILARLKAKGLKCVTVSELLAARTPASGKGQK
jgi:peptidoglycan/xylan/chitin deacetylase (PgdA/CDA1 family)